MPQDTPASPPRPKSAPPLEEFEIYPGVFIRVHKKDQCRGEYCCIHNPSDHALKGAPFNWRGLGYLMERVCEHGVGHPDPDHLAHIERQFGKERAMLQSVHGCDGCCSL